MQLLTVPGSEEAGVGTRTQGSDCRSSSLEPLNKSLTLHRDSVSSSVKAKRGERRENNKKINNAMVQT